MLEEIWAPLECIKQEEYIISNYGRVFSGKSGKYLNRHVGSRGYLQLSINGITYTVHRLVALTFIPNPEEKPEVNHKDNDRTNPRADNLEWVTHPENMEHAKTSGGFKNCKTRTVKKGKKSIRKLTMEQIQEARELHRKQKITWSIKNLALRYGISKSSMADIIHERTYRN